MLLVIFILFVYNKKLNDDSYNFVEDFSFETWIPSLSEEDLPHFVREAFRNIFDPNIHTDKNEKNQDTSIMLDNKKGMDDKI